MTKSKFEPKSKSISKSESESKSRFDSKTQSKRVRLTLENILGTAISLADEKGIESLSMRKLASELGVEAMSLYHHVSSREILLDGMVDRVFAELMVGLDFEDLDWKLVLRKISYQMREVLRSHPWAVGLLDSRRNPGSSTLNYQNRRLGFLRQIGFSVIMAGHIVALLDSYIYGFVMQEFALPFLDSESMEDVVEDVQGSFNKGDYPYLEEMISESVLQPGYSFYNEFDFGLELILNGIENAKIDNPKANNPQKEKSNQIRKKKI